MCTCSSGWCSCRGGRAKGFYRQDAKSAKKILRAEPDKRLDDLARVVVDAALEVHRELGPGLVEGVYEEALGLELRMRDIPFVRQHPVSVSYKGHLVGEGRVDLLVGNALIVELKAVEKLLPVHKAQVISYLKARGSILGLLIIFNERLLRDGIQRVVVS
jgi:GxxExxY protein